MRYFCFITLLVLGLPLYAQNVELNGTYHASFLGAESIRFTGKDSFYFNGFYCNYAVTGKGWCEIKNNRLYLHFEKTKASSLQDITIDRQPKENADQTTREPLAFPAQKLQSGEIYIYDLEAVSATEIVMKPAGSTERWRHYLKKIRLQSN